MIFNYNQVLGWWKLWYEHHNYLLFFIYCNPIFVIGIIIMTWTQTCTYTDYEIFFWKNIGNLVAPSKKKHLQRLKHINLTAIYTFFCFYYLIPFGYWYLDSDIDCRSIFKKWIFIFKSVYLQFAVFFRILFLSQQI